MDPELVALYERALRRARQKVFEDPSLEKRIAFLKKMLTPAWRERRRSKRQVVRDAQRLIDQGELEYARKVTETHREVC